MTGRVSALYRVPTYPCRGRALELCCGADPVVESNAWPGEVVITCDISPRGEPRPRVTPHRAPGFTTCAASTETPLPFAPDSFDIAILHGTLDDLNAAVRSRGGRFDAVLFLSRLAEVLDHGGVVAGCVMNRFGRSAQIPPAVDTGGGAREGGSPLARRGILSVSACRNVLKRAGFADVNLMGLYPDAAKPTMLRSLDPEIFRLTSRRQLSAMRSDLSPTGYLARRLYAASAVGARVPGTIFFWATKP